MCKELKKLLLEYLGEVTQEVRKKAASDKGREVVGGVINRPEDIEIKIDRVGEVILEKLLKKYKIKATVFSEPDGRDIKTGGENPDFYGAIDPFDESFLYMRGFQHHWYSVLSFYDEESNPIFTGVADILNEKFYLKEEKGNCDNGFEEWKEKNISYVC